MKANHASCAAAKPLTCGCGSDASARPSSTEAEHGRQSCRAFVEHFAQCEPTGHTETQTPHTALFAPTRSRRSRRAVSQHDQASTSLSLSTPACHSTPSMARAGHTRAQALHFPHRPTVMASPAHSGMSVRTVASLTLGPKRGVMSRAFFPTHPRPARVAAVLCWKATLRVLVHSPACQVSGTVAGNGSARYPRP